jgi:hypothetical protein
MFYPKEMIINYDDDDDDDDDDECNPNPMAWNGQWVDE